MFDTNIPGDDVFGGLSEAVRGSVDLNPQLTPDTLLTDLRGGAGITPNGSIEIAYVLPSTVVEAESVVVDLSTARTVGDVARLIEAGAPADADLRVSVTGDGLEIEVEPSSGTPGSVVIREVAAGGTAAELGILSETPATTISGSDLDAVVRLTSNLSDLLGTKATGRLELAGNSNDLILTANDVGADDRNNLTVDIVDGPLVGGLPSAAFADGSPPVLTVTVESGVSTAEEVAAAINAEGTFQASIDYRDADSAATAGAGAVTAVTETSVTDGGAGTSLDLASGLLITNGDDPFAIDTSGAETVEDLLNLLNQPENGLFAEINASQTGIEVRTRRSGADFTIGENGGNLATQLGIRTYTEESKLEDFNRGKGVVLDPITSSNEFTITVTDEGVTTTYQVDLEGDPDDTTDDARTVEDVLQRIADATGGVYANGAVTGGAIDASLATVGNGITLTSSAGAVAATPAASPPIALGADTLTFTATTPGAAGNTERLLD